MTNIVSEFSGAIGTAGTYIANVASASYSVISTYSTAIINALCSAGNSAGAALQKGWDFTVSTYSENRKVANYALATLAISGVAYAAYTNREQIANALSSFIEKK